jgi:hypothetical protein
MQYTDEQKRQAILIVSRAQSQEKGLAELHKVSGYEKVDRKMIGKWKSIDFSAEREKNARGRRANMEFEKDVLANLIFVAVRDLDGVETASVIANIAHSYHIIRMAAQTAQGSPKWKGDERIAKLKFTDPWVVGFLRRTSLRRRRVTTSNKNTPPPDVVRATMRSIQDVIIKEGYEPDDTVNGDETGIFYGAKPKNLYVPEDALRATAPDSNDKARFTALLWGAADGTMHAPFLIIKNSVSGADQTGSTCLDAKHLMSEEGFRESDGWRHKVWSKTVTLNVSGKPVTALYKRNYIINDHTGVVITANATAWMDSITMIMWIELQLGPWATKSGRAKLLVMDNCGPHSVQAVHDAFTAHNIRVVTLPPNMTGELQPMDLVVNGPVKAAIRAKRCEQLYVYLLQFKARWASELNKPVGVRNMPTFSPPKVAQPEGIRTLLATWQGRFASFEFREGLRRCFTNVGLRPIAGTEPPSFRNYTGGRLGTVARAFVPADSAGDDAFVLGDIAAEVEVESRPLELDHEDAAAAVVATGEPVVLTSFAPEPAVPEAGSVASLASVAGEDIIMAAGLGSGAASESSSSAAGAPPQARPTAIKVTLLKQEFGIPRMWHDYLDATATGSTSIMTRRLAKLRDTVATIVGLYTDLGNQDRVTLWKTQLAHADEAIKAGTAVGFDFKF